MKAFDVLVNGEAVASTDTFPDALERWATEARKILVMPPSGEGAGKDTVEIRHNDENFFTRFTREYGPIA